MSIITKNLFFALTIISLLALTVFVVQLIIINTGTEQKEPDSLVTGGTPGDNTGAQGGQETEGDTSNPFDGYVPPTEEPRPTPEGKRYEITVSTGVTLVVFAEEEKFTFAEEDLVWRFEYRGGGEAAVDIGFALITQQSPSDDTERFLNMRTGGNNAEFIGTRQIMDSQMSGYNVSATIDNVNYEAWFYKLPDDDLSIAFLINYEFNNQRDDMYELLSSMSIEQG